MLQCLSRLPPSDLRDAHITIAVDNRADVHVNNPISLKPRHVFMQIHPLPTAVLLYKNGSGCVKV